MNHTIVSSWETVMNSFNKWSRKNSFWMFICLFFLLVWKICKQKYMKNKDFLFASLKNEALNRNFRIEIRTEVIPRFHKEFYDAKGKLFCYYLGPRYWKDFTQLCLKATLFWAAALRNFDFLTRYGDFDAWHFFNTDLASKVINAKYSVVRWYY